MHHLFSASVGKVRVFMVFYDDAHLFILPNNVGHINKKKEYRQPLDRPDDASSFLFFALLSFYFLLFNPSTIQPHFTSFVDLSS